MAEDIRWITAAEVADNYQPKNGGGGGPGGGDTQAQFNDDGAFGVDTQFTYHKTTHQLKFLGSASIALGFNDDAAHTGRIRLDNGGGIYARNVDNDADILLLVSNGAPGGGDSIVIGDSTTGYIETRAGSGHEFSIVSAPDGVMAIQSAGELGINGAGNLLLQGAPIDLYPYSGNDPGTATIHGVLALVPMTEPTSPVEGMVYAGTDHHLYYYNGTAWKQLDNTL